MKPNKWNKFDKTVERTGSKPGALSEEGLSESGSLAKALESIGSRGRRYSGK